MTALDLHRRAMSRWDESEVATDPETRAHLVAEAAELERKAADAATGEPTRGILYRSAAWFAIEAGKPEDARRCVDLGLAGDPPECVRRELHDVLRALKGGRG